MMSFLPESDNLNLVTYSGTKPHSAWSDTILLAYLTKISAHDLVARLNNCPRTALLVIRNYNLSQKIGGNLELILPSLMRKHAEVAKFVFSEASLWARLDLNLLSSFLHDNPVFLTTPGVLAAIENGDKFWFKGLIEAHGEYLLIHIANFLEEQTTLKLNADDLTTLKEQQYDPDLAELAVMALENNSAAQKLSSPL